MTKAKPKKGPESKQSARVRARQERPDNSMEGLAREVAKDPVGADFVAHLRSKGLLAAAKK